MTSPPQVFLAHVKEFVEQLESANYINLFLTELRYGLGTQGAQIWNGGFDSWLQCTTHCLYV